MRRRSRHPIRQRLKSRYGDPAPHQQPTRPRMTIEAHTKIFLCREFWVTAAGPPCGQGICASESFGVVVAVAAGHSFMPSVGGASGLTKDSCRGILVNLIH